MSNDNEKLLGNLGRGKLIVMSAPAGTGKTTLMQMLVEEFPCVIQSISFTTRASRPEEVDGVHYQFIDRGLFEEKVEAGEFLEYVKLYGDYYGTSQEWVDERLEKGYHVFLVIDTQGALQLMERKWKPEDRPIFIFLSPPTLEELKERLLKRRTESPEVIERRLTWAKQEMNASEKYDYRIINDNLHIAYQVLRSILIAEEHRVRK